MVVGNEVDASEIQLLFQELGFNVREYVNLTLEQMRDVFQEQASINHGAYSTFGACILSEAGDKENTFHATNGMMDVEEVIKIIDKSESLRRKPKLFILHFTPGSSSLIC